MGTPHISPTLKCLFHKSAKKFVKIPFIYSMAFYMIVIVIKLIVHQ